MSWIFGIADKRKKQLIKEKEIDYKLKELTKDCPVIYLNFLLKCRDINREQFFDVSKKNIFSQFDLINENLDSLDNLYLEIEQLLINNENPCTFLLNYY